MLGPDPGGLLSRGAEGPLVSGRHREVNEKCPQWPHPPCVLAGRRSPVACPTETSNPRTPPSIELGWTTPPKLQRDVRGPSGPSGPHSVALPGTESPMVPWFRCPLKHLMVSALIASAGWRGNRGACSHWRKSTRTRMHRADQYYLWASGAGIASNASAKVGRITSLRGRMQARALLGCQINQQTARLGRNVESSVQDSQVVRACPAFRGMDPAHESRISRRYLWNWS